jgi:hypothetical protein
MADTTAATATETPWAPWLARITAARKRRDDRVAEWQRNVERRSGYTNRSTEHYNSFKASATSGIAVNKDWPITKAKIAQLFSQMPEVRLSPRWPEFQQATTSFGRELNDTLADVGVGSTIEEVLADVVNASGIGGAIVTCEKRTIAKAMPADPATLPPDVHAQVLAGTMAMPTEEVEETADLQYLAERISPPDLLIPSDFTGSDYDKGRWIGHEGRLTWIQALVGLAPDETNRGLTEADQEKVLGRDKRGADTSKTLNPDTDKFRDTDVITYQELFYWRHFYHADETSFKALQRLVFVDGLDEPVINEPYRAQQIDPTSGRMLGVTKFPIRILTLTYISDESLPPSDSSIIRGQVAELEESRQDMMLQRKHSVPMRWGDTNRVSANTRTKLETGEYQSFIWTNGPGDRAIGEVARASYPPEKFEFDKVINNDITEQVQVGTNQAGAFAPGGRSAREAGIIERNFQRRVGQEQDKVSRFLLGIAEVLAGHLAIYGPAAGPDELGGVERAALSTGFTYSVRVDATVRLDAQQQIEQLEHIIDRSAQSPFMDVRHLMAQWLELQGQDPAKSIIEPQPKPPEPVKVSVSKAEDLMNPLFVALLMRTGQGPSPEDLAAAKKLLAEAGMPIIPVLPPPAEGDGAPPREGATPGIANPDWQMAPRQDKRDEDGGL